MEGAEADEMGEKNICFNCFPVICCKLCLYVCCLHVCGSGRKKIITKKFG